MTLPVGLAQTIFGDIYPVGPVDGGLADHLGSGGHLLHVGPALHGGRPDRGQREGIADQDRLAQRASAIVRSVRSLGMH